MLIKWMPIARLNPAPYNPRVKLGPGNPDYERLHRSVDEFGMVQSLVYNKRTKHLVGGHQRYWVLVARGAKRVQVVVVDLPLAKEKLLNLALNKVQGRWDQPMLDALVAELTTMPGVDVTLSGFDAPDIEAMVASALATSRADQEETFDVEKAIDEARSRPAVTQLGDVIQLNGHAVVCGDSADAATIAGVVKAASVGLLFTDPPYNVDYDASARNRRSRKSSIDGNAPRRPKLANDALDQKQYERWFRKVLDNVRAALMPGAAVYIWNGTAQFGPMHTMLLTLGIHVSCVITWAKERFAIGRGDYKQQTEFCLYGWFAAAKGRHRWFGKHDQSTLWNVPRDPAKSYVHPTQKPLELAERAMRNSSRPGEIVLDPFLGSGTTLIAAERTRRRCVGVELDPHFCDVIVRRYVAFTGGAGLSPDLIERYRVAPADRRWQHECIQTWFQDH